MDIFERILKDSGGPLGRYRRIAHGYFAFPKLEGEIGPWMYFNGKKVLNWSLNNYLGLANHPEVRKVDAEAASKYGLAYPMGARMMSGQTIYHEELEKELAKFVGKEDAYVLNYGYQGMISILDCLLTRNDVAIYDSESHACIIDGLKMHLGKRLVYPHNDINKLEEQLKKAQKIIENTKGGILVITEGVYGMAGDLGKLKDIVELKKKYNFRLLIDDAHGFGTMGINGAGTHEHFQVIKDVDIYFATFAKAFAAIGAFVASDKEIIDYLRYNMRSQIFAKSLPLPIVIGVLKRLEIVKSQPELRKNLWNIVNKLQNGLKENGLNIGKTESPVTPVYLSGSPIEAGNLVIDLRENYNIFCSVVIYPVVPKDVIMLRLIPTAIHTENDVNITISALKNVYENLNNKKYSKETISFF